MAPSFPELQGWLLAALPTVGPPRLSRSDRHRLRTPPPSRVRRRARKARSKGSRAGIVGARESMPTLEALECQALVHMFDQSNGYESRVAC